MVQTCLLMYIVSATLLVATTHISESCQNSLVTVQLVHGTSERNGRVELCWENQWKAVCDDGWGQEEANTVCGELGYLNDNVRAIAVTGSHFGEAHEIHQLIQWNCEPTDTVLAYCDKSVARTTCTSSETAGVYCQGTDNCEDGEVRLRNGSTPSSYEGRVEICFNRVWGTVCGNDWDSRDAIVVCRQLGLTVSSISIGVSSSQFYGEGEGPILLDGIDCGENDTRLADCARLHLTPGMVDGQCTHKKDAGVICNGCDCIDGEIRLNGGQTQLEGIVEICFGGVWGTICDDGWDESDARVACRQLGYNKGIVKMKMEYEGVAQKIPHLGKVNCTGEESRLTECGHEGIGVHTCLESSNWNADSAVMCSEPFGLSPTTSIQALCIKECSFVASVWHTFTIFPSIRVTTFTETTPPSSTPQHVATMTQKLTTRNKIIIGGVCGCMALVFLIATIAIGIYSCIKRKRKTWTVQQHARKYDENQQQISDNSITKEEISTSSSLYQDQVLEHKFLNLIYDMGGTNGLFVDNIACSSTEYSEVRLQQLSDTSISKEAILISQSVSSLHQDQALEHNFPNPIYDVGETSGLIVGDTVCGSTGYSEVRLSIVQGTEDDSEYDCENRDHETEI